MIKVSVNLFAQYQFLKKNAFSSNLDNLKLLFKQYGNFHNKIKVFNVVGTNGKGSVASFLGKQLENNFKKVGLFTSPSFLYHNERIAINSKYIDDQKLKFYLNKYENDFKKYHLNFFEIFTFIAALYFYQEKVDVAVIEAGIGGIKDATAVFLNQKGVILTAIAKDHQNILGKSYQSIIENKILIRQDKKTPLFIAHSNQKFLAYFKKFSNFYLAKNKYLPPNLDLFQIDNVNLVMTVCRFFHFKIINSYFKKPLLLGRFMRLNFHNQEIIFDGAHNKGALKILVANLRLITSFKKIIVLFATSKSKRFYQMKEYLKQFYKVYLTEFNHFKAYKVKNYEKINYVQEKNWAYFLKKHRNKIIVVCGSIYFESYFYQFLLNLKDTKKYYNKVLKK